MSGNKKPCSRTCTSHITQPCEKCGQQWFNNGYEDVEKFRLKFLNKDIYLGSGKIKKNKTYFDSYNNLIASGEIIFNQEINNMKNILKYPGDFYEYTDHFGYKKIVWMDCNREVKEMYCCGGPITVSEAGKQLTKAVKEFFLSIPVVKFVYLFIKK